MKLFFGIILIVPLIAILTWRTVAWVNYDINCSGYIKRAADANTVETAKSQLEIVIKYLEEHDLTKGYCSIFFKQPCNDIGFWYNNIKASYNELCSIQPTTTQLEKTNVLMKLRETLLDNGDSGTKITMPEGISIYPYNKLFFWLTIFFLIIAIGGCVLIIQHFEEW